MSEGKNALVTGASRGIGNELARVLAREGFNLLLVARSEEEMQALKEELESRYRRAVYVISQDLSLPDGPDQVFQRLEAEGLNVDILINNAGFGEYGLFVETSWKKEEAMIRLNITALSRLCKLFLPGMLRRGSGRIMNVASTAAFQPGPLMAIYYATKAYVLSFTRALAEEYPDSRVTFTVLCPGPTRSDFSRVAGTQKTRVFSDRTVASARSVAEYGYRAMMKGTVVAVPGIMNSLGTLLAKFLPGKLITRAVRHIQENKAG